MSSLLAQLILSVKAITSATLKSLSDRSWFNCLFIIGTQNRWQTRYRNQHFCFFVDTKLNRWDLRILNLFNTHYDLHRKITLSQQWLFLAQSHQNAYAGSSSPKLAALDLFRLFHVPLFYIHLVQWHPKRNGSAAIANGRWIPLWLHRSSFHLRLYPKGWGIGEMIVRVIA